LPLTRKQPTRMHAGPRGGHAAPPAIRRYWQTNPSGFSGVAQTLVHMHGRNEDAVPWISQRHWRRAWGHRHEGQCWGPPAPLPSNPSPGGRRPPPFGGSAMSRRDRLEWGAENSSQVSEDRERGEGNRCQVSGGRAGFFALLRMTSGGDRARFFASLRMTSVEMISTSGRRRATASPAPAGVSIRWRRSLRPAGGTPKT